MLRVLGTYIASGRFVSGSVGQAVFTRLKEHTAQIAVTLSRWTKRAQQRQQLHDLDAHLLHDIGIDRREVLRQTSKPFWQD